MLLLLVFSFFIATTAAGNSCPGSKIAEAYRDILLNGHNDVRSRIALGQFTGAGKSVPPAADMMKMEWDCELEKSAQKWSESTNNCDMIHSEMGETRPDNTGENIGVNWSYTNNITAALIERYDSLAGEYDECDFQSAIFDSDGCDIGHTTQIAWSSSSRLGCGITLCDATRPNPLNSFNFFLVCQYAPGGNIPEFPIYEVGLACSKCPSDTVCEHSTGLCTKAGVEQTETTTTATATKIQSETTEKPANTIGEVETTTSETTEQTGTTSVEKNAQSATTTGNIESEQMTTPAAEQSGTTRAERTTIENETAGVETTTLEGITGEDI